MNRIEWQKHHGLTDDEMSYLTEILMVFNGKIVAVHDSPWAVINRKFIEMIDYLTKLIGLRK